MMYSAEIKFWWRGSAARLIQFVDVYKFIVIGHSFFNATYLVPQLPPFRHEYEYVFDCVLPFASHESTSNFHGPHMFPRYYAPSVFLPCIPYLLTSVTWLGLTWRPEIHCPANIFWKFTQVCHSGRSTSNFRRTVGHLLGIIITSFLHLSLAWRIDS